MKIELLKDVAAMRLYGVRAQLEDVGDLLVRPALR
jgi:hypothetical protein